MSKTIALAALSAALFWSPSAAAQADGGLVVRDVTVVSPERAEPLEHANVLIREGRIVEVTTRPVAAEREIDGRGRFLVPGLVDGHVHLGATPGMIPPHERTNPGAVAAARAQEPRSYLYHGFTTLVDLAATPDRIAGWKEHDLRPDVHFCGGAPIANGYPMVFAPESERFRHAPYFLYDERQRDRIPAEIDPGAHTPEAVVARMAADGAICVKTHYETGFGAMRDLPTPTVETLRALVDAAHARGMPVTLHANSLEAQQFALAAGVDVIVHGLWNGLDGDGTELGAEADALLRDVAERGIGYQPTIQVLHGELDVFDEDYLDQPGIAHVYPASLLEWLRTAVGGWFRDELRGSLGDRDVNSLYAPMLRRLGRIVETLDDRGARLLFGSDTPSGPTYANPPGLNGLLEMRRWIAAGVDEARLFRALTLDNARAFGLDGEIGSVEPGKTAHLLLLRANPLESVDAYDSIETVILDGRTIERARLSALQAPEP